MLSMIDGRCYVCVLHRGSNTSLVRAINGRMALQYYKLVEISYGIRDCKIFSSSVFYSSKQHYFRYRTSTF